MLLEVIRASWRSVQFSLSGKITKTLWTQLYYGRDVCECRRCTCLSVNPGRMTVLGQRPEIFLSRFPNFTWNSNFWCISSPTFALTMTLFKSAPPAPRPPPPPPRPDRRLLYPVPIVFRPVPLTVYLDIFSVNIVQASRFWSGPVLPYLHRPVHPIFI